MERQGLTQSKIISEVLRIGHGKLDQFVSAGMQAVGQDPELFAHLIAWNEKKGEVRDSKKAFPVIALRGHSGPGNAFAENAAAHMCLLDPKDFLSSVRMHMSLHHKKETRAPLACRRMVDAAAKRYIREREQHNRWFDSTAVQHRKSLVNLYRIFRVHPSDRAKGILFEGKRPAGSVFEAVSMLKKMDQATAAGMILKFRIPFLIAVGAVGGFKDKPDVVLAMIEQMSPAELITNTGMLKKCGVFENPMLHAAYENKAKEAARDKRVSTLKAGKAAKVMEAVDTKSAKKLEAIQEARLDEGTRIKGNVLILGDKSGSMEMAVDAAKQTASLIARKCDGEVHLVFFNEAPQRYDVTGKSLEEIQRMTSHVRAGGATSIGCGFDMVSELGKQVDTIVVCSDGGENRTPWFHEVYLKYVRKNGLEPTVYLFRFPGDPNVLAEHCRRANIVVQEFVFGAKVDPYALINVVNVIKPGRFALYEEIMAVPLLTLDDVFKKR